MHTWFETKVRYEKTLESGKTKKVNELYLVNALSFTEAEARIVQEVAPYITGEFTVSEIKRAEYPEVFPSENASDDRWVRCKLELVTLDEKNGAEKKTISNVLVQAADTKAAMERIAECMKGTMSDFKVVAVTETKIMDVFPFESQKKEEEV